MIFSFSSFIKTRARLARKGILGINRRNADYILLYNQRQYYPNVDNKLRTKKLCASAGLPVPRTFCVLDRYGQVPGLNGLLAGKAAFVIKPSGGAAGRGIVVISKRPGQTFQTPGGRVFTLPELQYHVRSVLSGLYSLGGQPDRALVEEMIQKHTIFETIAVGGTPDIRVVVFQGIPVMAMLRLPTRLSGGRANLHQGAIAAGVEVSSGKTMGGVWKSRFIDRHPDTAEQIGGLEVPQWETILRVSSRLAEVVQLGYLGVDFVLDAKAGPVVLEANARPGLSIQVANRSGLLPRLREVEKNQGRLHTIQEKLDFARNRF